MMNPKIFWTTLVLFGAMIFALNYNHASEVGIYNFWYRPMAENIIENHTYSLPSMLEPRNKASTHRGGIPLSCH